MYKILYKVKLICFPFQVAIDNILHGSSVLIEQVKENLRKKVTDYIQDRCDQSVVASVGEIFDSSEDPFQNLGTARLQSSYIEKSYNYVRPIQYVLGRRLPFKDKGAKRQICEKEDTMVYIPIIDSIQQLLSNPKICDLVIRQHRQCKEGVLYDICDGECLKGNPIFQQNTNALQIVIYHDEIDVCNPLGSHVGKHKIDLYYYTLANISPKFRSKLCAIRLLAIAKAKHVSIYGQNKVLTPIVNDLCILSRGHTFSVNGRPVTLHGAVVSGLGDTEGQHQWGGFKVKVGWSHQKCRNCLCSFDDMQQKFRDDDFTLRNLPPYLRQCNDIETAPTKAAKENLQTTYGLTERTMLCNLPYFDITKQLPQDIMHVLLEGSVQYELRYILEQFFNDGQITLRQLNSLFDNLNLGYLEESNRPQPLKETIFDGNEHYKLKQTAEQAHIFLKSLPFALDGYVDKENPYYKLMTQLLLIVHICFAPVISKRSIGKLKDLIEMHLKKFKELFPTVNITPKMHYMIHIPQQKLQLGPMLRSSCIRFEAKHNYFKEIAPLQNFKNICLSLAEKCQIDECANFWDESEDPSTHPLFSQRKSLGPLV